MPPAVADRMLKRIIPFAALPVVGGIVLFGAFYYATTQLELDVPPTIVAYATQAMLLLSFGGITYGVMSTQLDEEAEGEGAAEEGAGGTGVETPVLTCSLHWWVKGAREFHSPNLM